MTQPSSGSVRVRLDLNREAIYREMHGETRPVVKFVRDTTRQTRTRAVLRCPVDTGNLRNGHYERVEITRGAVTGVVGNDVPYARYVHDGTRPHLITPRRPGGVLRFKVGGEVVFTTYARHPGTRAQPWLETSLIEVAVPRGFTVRRL